MSSPPELHELLELTQRVGSDPLLTQASTGNSSAKLNGVLWVKASGRKMADALTDDILVPLNLTELLTECLPGQIDPAERYPRASLETAMHAALPQRIVLHVHCVNTIPWAVRSDAPTQLQRLLEGLSWRWIPYVASGLPLAFALSERAGADVFVLGNHGLVIAGESVRSVEALLNEVKHRLDIQPRRAPRADYAALFSMSRDSLWHLPEDEAIHALGTDPTAQTVLAGGLLYPCQAIFSDSRTPEPFCPVPPSGLDQYRNRPFLIVEGRGVLVSRSITVAELAMLSGLAQVVQRLGADTALRYLTDADLAGVSSHVAHRYRDLACTNR